MDREDGSADKSGTGAGSDVTLSRRELEVLELCAEGRSDVEIASALNLSTFTVGNHVRRILRKTGTTNRTMAVRWGFKQGLLNTDDRPGSRTDLFEIPTLSILPRAKESHLSQTERRSMQLASGLEQALAEPRAWEPVLDEVGAAFDSHIPMVTWTNIPSGYELSVTYAPRMGPDWQERYDHHYAAINPLISIVAGSPVDFFAVTDDYAFPPSFYEHPFYREYCRALDIEAAAVWTVFPDDLWAVELFLARRRTAPPPTPAQRELGVLLFPYVRHTLLELWQGASRTHTFEAGPVSTTNGAPAASTSHDATTAAIYVDEKLRMIVANDQAEQLLRDGTWIRYGPAGPSAQRPHETRALRQALRQAVRAAVGDGYAAPQSLVLHARDELHPPLNVTITPRLADRAAAPVPSARARALIRLEPPGER